MAVLATLLTEQKASQSLPAFQATVLNRRSRHPRGDGPEVMFVVPLPVALPAFVAGRSKRRATASITRSAPDAVSRPRHPVEHAFHASRGCVCLPGSPRARAHRLDTALHFRSGADPCEWMASRIQNRSTGGEQGRTLPPTPIATHLERGPASTTPQPQKCASGTDHPFHF